MPLTLLKHRKTFLVNLDLTLNFCYDIIVSGLAVRSKQGIIFLDLKLQKVNWQF